jgi:internalin A
MSEQQPNQNLTFSRFADWCLHKDSLSAEARHTVEVLLKKAGTSDCYEAEKILSSYTNLEVNFLDISNLSPLSTLTNLTYLSLVGNQISDLKPLSNLTNLRHLGLSGNKISDLSPISKLENLDFLAINTNQIWDLNPLCNLTNLTALFLAYNQISDLKPLSQLGELRILHLYRNRITDISPLSKLINLNTLYIYANNNILDLSPLLDLVNLDMVVIDDTSISDLSIFINLKTHTTINAVPKRVYDLSRISPIEQKLNALLTAPINIQKCVEALNLLYKSIGIENHKIIFLPSPQPDFKDSSNKKSIRETIAQKINQAATTKINFYLWLLISEQVKFHKFIYASVYISIEQHLNENFLDSVITSPSLFTAIGATELAVQEFNYQLDQKEQKALECLNQLLENCGWIFAFEEVCIVCDRPRKISLDSDNQLHAEAEPAIQFADGWHTGYYYHGVKIPEQYGKLHFSEWQPQWLLEEDNAEVRRVLIQVIGYDRICEELQAQVLDSWQEYTLLCIAADVDVEPIHLLKMTCPSTGRIHILRVPPEITSAREAIRWVNWDIDPENFSVQT